MGRVIFYISFVMLFLGNNIKAQLLLEENFDYPAYTDLATVGWELYGTNYSINCEVSVNGLSYTNYASSNFGLGAQIYKQTNSDDVRHLFNAQTTGSIYLSFLINITKVINPSNPTGANAFITLNNLARVVAVKAGSYLNFGIVKGSTSTNALIGTSIFNQETTYLLVLKYSFIEGSNNDEVILWVFSDPNVPSSEPLLYEVMTTEGSDETSINAIYIRQDISAIEGIIDGIRVATSWSQAPIPVKLTSFTASLSNNQVHLKWHTATEINNYGFDVEKQVSAQQSSVGNWAKIGFVAGNGNSNSPKEYSFIDKDLNKFGKYFYRLKQIDSDGKYEYSKEAEIIYCKNINSLEQNYPNPFNPATTISYTISSPGIVSISLFNILGKKAKEILNEFKEPGSYSFEFSIKDLERDLPSGVYFYKISANGYSQIKKMMILK